MFSIISSHLYTIVYCASCTCACTHNVASSLPSFSMMHAEKTGEPGIQFHMTNVRMHAPPQTKLGKWLIATL